MKKNFTLLFVLHLILTFAQNGAPASPYYNSFNWNQSGTALKNALATKITNTHTNLISYTPGVWEASKVTDLDPNNSNNVLLIYGWENGSDSDLTNDISRDKNAICSGPVNCNTLWNREHVFARSLGNPVLDQDPPSDAGEDAHNLRPSDVNRNSSRGNLKFVSGSGNSANVGGGWYPGDEWKGDVARMMMYMYLRYGNQCLPINVGIGNPVASDANMIDLFLQWNAEDPVSQYEDNRNTYHGNTSNTYAQGNRNPFIDNPYLATVIWGGTVAQNRWPSIYLSSKDFDFSSSISVYPNPAINNTIYITSTTTLLDIAVYNINGQIVQDLKNPNTINKETYEVSNLNTGFYLIKIATENGTIIKKVIVN